MDEKLRMLCLVRVERLTEREIKKYKRFEPKRLELKVSISRERLEGLTQENYLGKTFKNAKERYLKKLKALKITGEILKKWSVLFGDDIDAEILPVTPQLKTESLLDSCSLAPNPVDHQVGNQSPTPITSEIADSINLNLNDLEMVDQLFPSNLIPHFPSITIPASSVVLFDETSIKVSTIDIQDSERRGKPECSDRKQLPVTNSEVLNSDKNEKKPVDVDENCEKPVECVDKNNYFSSSPVIKDEVIEIDEDDEVIEIDEDDEKIADINEDLPSLPITYPEVDKLSIRVRDNKYLGIDDEIEKNALSQEDNLKETHNSITQSRTDSHHPLFVVIRLDIPKSSEDDANVEIEQTLSLTPFQANYLADSSLNLEQITDMSTVLSNDKSGFFEHTTEDDARTMQSMPDIPVLPNSVHSARWSDGSNLTKQCNQFNRVQHSGSNKLVGNPSFSAGKEGTLTTSTSRVLSSAPCGQSQTNVQVSNAHHFEQSPQTQLSSGGSRSTSSSTYNFINTQQTIPSNYEPIKQSNYGVANMNPYVPYRQPQSNQIQYAPNAYNFDQNGASSETNTVSANPLVATPSVHASANLEKSNPVKNNNVSMQAAPLRTIPQSIQFQAPQMSISYPRHGQLQSNLHASNAQFEQQRQSLQTHNPTTNSQPIAPPLHASAQASLQQNSSMSILARNSTILPRTAAMQQAYQSKLKEHIQLNYGVANMNSYAPYRKQQSKLYAPNAYNVQQNAASSEINTVSASPLVTKSSIHATANLEEINPVNNNNNNKVSMQAASFRTIPQSSQLQAPQMTSSYPRHGQLQSNLIAFNAQFQQQRKSLQTHNPTTNSQLIPPLLHPSPQASLQQNSSMSTFARNSSILPRTTMQQANQSKRKDLFQLSYEMLPSSSLTRSTTQPEEAIPRYTNSIPLDQQRSNPPTYMQSESRIALKNSPILVPVEAKIDSYSHGLTSDCGPPRVSTAIGIQSIDQIVQGLQRNSQLPDLSADPTVQAILNQSVPNSDSNVIGRHGSQFYENVSKCRGAEGSRGSRGRGTRARGTPGSRGTRGTRGGRGSRGARGGRGSRGTRGARGGRGSRGTNGAPGGMVLNSSLLTSDLQQNGELHSNIYNMPPNLSAWNFG